MFRSWFRKHALAFPTYLSPAILTVFLSHPASFILRFDLFYWHESCWLLRKTHDCWCYSQKTLPIRIQENCKYRGKPNASEALCGYKNITSPIVYSTRVVKREFIIRHHTRLMGHSLVRPCVECTSKIVSSRHSLSRYVFWNVSTYYQSNLLIKTSLFLIFLLKRRVFQFC